MKRYFIVLECRDDEAHSAVVDLLRDSIGQRITYINVAPDELAMKVFLEVEEDDDEN